MQEMHVLNHTCHRDFKSSTSRGLFGCNNPAGATTSLSLVETVGENVSQQPADHPVKLYIVINASLLAPRYVVFHRYWGSWNLLLVDSETGPGPIYTVVVDAEHAHSPTYIC